MTDQKAPSQQSIDDYIAQSAPEHRQVLQRIRETIHTAVPEATESISYNMPTFNLDGKYLVYFAAWHDHIGLYPYFVGDEELEALLAPYKKAKSSIHIPYDDPFPYHVVEKFALHRKAQETV